MSKDKIPGVKIGKDGAYDALAQYQGAPAGYMCFCIQHFQWKNPRDTRASGSWHTVRTFCDLKETLAMVERIRKNVPRSRLRISILTEQQEGGEDA